MGRKSMLVLLSVLWRGGGRRSASVGTGGFRLRFCGLLCLWPAGVPRRSLVKHRNRFWIDPGAHQRGTGGGPENLVGLRDLFQDFALAAGIPDRVELGLLHHGLAT